MLRVTARITNRATIHTRSPARRSAPTAMTLTEITSHHWDSVWPPMVVSKLTE